MPPTPIRQLVPLGQAPWPTLDPFLFCVHHDDAYPAGTAQLGPAPALLRGRDIGQDFGRQDGWSMYHGDVVPGFPGHPHRGFETVTIVLQGHIDHSDSLGATARFGAGDVQWLTAGQGIVHAEMFPLLDPAGPNPTELFQIWLNLPAASKRAAPHFQMMWREALPTARFVDAAGRATEALVVAGDLGEVRAPAPPPDSWAARPEAALAIWVVTMAPGARWTPPPAGEDVGRTLYAFEGPGLTVAGQPVPPRHGALVAADAAAELVAGPAGNRLLVLQGRPIGEPVAQHGPFVMNTADEIRQAFADYQATGFGGWPWPSQGPVHARDAGRFARFPDGRVERPA